MNTYAKIYQIPPDEEGIVKNRHVSKKPVKHFFEYTLHCIQCNKPAVISSWYLPDLKAYNWCDECKLKHTCTNLPKQITKDHVLINDTGNHVLVKYLLNGNKEEIKLVYLSKKGRYIKINSKNEYL